MRSKCGLLAAGALACGGIATAAFAGGGSPVSVTFITATEQLANNCVDYGITCSSSPIYTMTVTHTGGVATIDVLESDMGSPTLIDSFTLPAVVVSATSTPYGAPVFAVSQLLSYSWAVASPGTTPYQYVTLYPSADGGGLTIGDEAGDDIGSNDLFDSFQSSAPYPPFFSDPSDPGVPEASTWALMIVGGAGVGLAMRRRRASTAAAA